MATRCPECETRNYQNLVYCSRCKTKLREPSVPGEPTPEELEERVAEIRAEKIARGERPRPRHA